MKRFPTLIDIMSRPQGIFLVVCFMCLMACNNDLSKLPPDASLKDLDNDRATDVTFIKSENGKVKAKLHTQQFIQNESAKPPYIDMLNGLKVEFFDDSMRVESTLTARSARYYPQEQNVIARDSVVVVNNKGEKLQTEELIWNSKLERIYTEKFVRITKGDQINYGDGLEATQDFKWSRIKKLRGSIPVSNSDLPLE